MDVINHARDRDQLSAALRRNVGVEVNLQHKGHGHVIDIEIALIGAATRTPQTKGAAGGNPAMEHSFLKGTRTYKTINSRVSFVFGHSCFYSGPVAETLKMTLASMLAVTRNIDA